MKCLFKNSCILFFVFNFALIAQDNAAHIKGEVLVMLHKTGQIEKLLNNNTELHLKQVISKRSGIHLLSFDSLQNEQMILNKLRTNSEIEIAQFNHTTQSRALPDDLQFGVQYALHNTGQSGGTVDADIDAPEAWDITTGGLTSTGDSIVIAIIDDGFQLTHPDLNFWKNNFEIAANGIDDDGNGFIDDTKGWNASNNSNNIVLAQHGTHVTGIAAAKGNNAMGVSGVDWKSKVMPVIGSTTLESVAVAAYTYVLECRRLYNETNGAKGAFVVVTNSSFGVNQGQPANFPLWCAMYDSLGKQGILSVCATANNNWDVDVVGDIPTACTSNYMITVASTNRNDGRVTTSAYGPNSIDLAAPGSAILSTYATNTYTTLSGTSMAAPFVAGTIGLMYAAACDSFIQLYKQFPDSFAMEVKSFIINGVDQKVGFDTLYFSGGRLNAHTSIVDFQNYFNCYSLGLKKTEKGNFVISPNPAMDKLTIFNIDSNPIKSIKVIDVNGKTISILNFENNNSHKIEINISTWSNGVYHLHLTDSQGNSTTHKLVKIGS